MATKFSQFNQVLNPSYNQTELVGLDSGANCRVLTGSNLLNTIANAANRTDKDMLYINNNAVDFINPSAHPNIPVRISLYAEWLNKGGNSYFNIPKSSLTNIPYNDEQSNANTNSVAGSALQ